MSDIRPFIDPILNALGKRMASIGVSANSITCIGFLFGVFAISMIALQQYGVATFFICLNRLADGLDGAVARNTHISDFGGFLDIVCDFIIYSGIVLAFGLAKPCNLIYSAFLIFSFVGPITSFLAYAIIASKRQIISEKRGKKSFYYLGGICEGTETATVLILFCVIPQYFSIISIVFGILCWVTTIGRIYNAWIDFGNETHSVKNHPSLVSYKKPEAAIEPQVQ